MNLPAAMLSIRWLVLDTFRQSLASRIFHLMLGISVLSIVFCLSVSTGDLPRKPMDEQAERMPKELVKSPEEAKGSGIDVIGGQVTFLFGKVGFPWRQYADDAVRWLHLVLAAFVADTAGLLLTLIWTAAFLPTFLEPASVTVLLAKPVPRWSLLAGKYLGVVIFVLLQVSVFVAGTWMALAIRTGVWDPHYLMCIPFLVLHFAIFFSFSTLLAVWSRSTVVCVFGSLVFWLLCWSVNYGRHTALEAVTEYGQVSGSVSWALEAGYWMLPKPADFTYLLSQSLGAESYTPVDTTYKVVEEAGELNGEMSLISSLLFAGVMLAVAGYEFVQAEY